MPVSIRELPPDEFPPLLREIPDAPATLWLRGSLPPPGVKLLTVVGSRKYTPYGKAAVEKLIRGLAGYPVAVVSGLALGIDSLAHEAALAAELQTIAVPGSGLSPNALYPRAHLRLSERILAAGGALLSEFPPEFRARPESFPQRNRIMAGMADAVLVVEAALRSGTLVTAKLAVEYNRELLVVPGSIFSPNSFGPHLFLSLGAAPAATSADVLKALRLEARPSPAAERLALTDAERRVLAALCEPKTADDLAEELALPARDANILLSALELKGLIIGEFGKIRARDI